MTVKLNDLENQENIKIIVKNIRDGNRIRNSWTPPENVDPKKLTGDELRKFVYKWTDEESKFFEQFNMWYGVITPKTNWYDIFLDKTFINYLMSNKKEIELKNVVEYFNAKIAYKYNKKVWQEKYSDLDLEEMYKCLRYKRVFEKCDEARLLNDLLSEDNWDWAFVLDHYKHMRDVLLSNCWDGSLEGYREIVRVTENNKIKAASLIREHIAKQTNRLIKKIINTFKQGA